MLLAGVGLAEYGVQVNSKPGSTSNDDLQLELQINQDLDLGSMSLSGLTHFDQNNSNVDYMSSSLPNYPLL